ncbi:UNVERIFIED_CONTAM: beta-N-acetylhexosaminidase [Brevibacillus sp. OAP136]
MELSQMTLAQKLGQMVMCGFHGETCDEQLRALITRQHVGGIIYFTRNVVEPKQIHELSSALQQAAIATNGIPLLIATDQEGGMVTRIKSGVTPIPGQMALGAAGDEQAVRQLACISGGELRHLGINMNLAPCLDIQNNPRNPVIGVRSYGSDPHRVARMGAAAIEGYQEAGIVPVVKHFPGHGDTSVDSHLAVPSIPHDLARLRERELVPFVEAITCGADVVMTAHVLFSAIDDTLPTTLSKPVLTGLLREQLGFDGVIMTDCMEMKAIADTFGTEKAAVMAVEAGADIILISHTYDSQLGALRALHEAVEAGVLTEERIDRSVSRILHMKKKWGVMPSPLPWVDAQEQLARPEAIACAKALSAKSITVVRDEARLIPLQKEENVLVIYPKSAVTTGADERIETTQSLGEQLARYGYRVIETRIDANPTLAEMEAVLAKSKEAEQLVVATYNAQNYPAQLELLQLLTTLHGTKRLVAVALRNPYDATAAEQIGTYVATYESSPLALESLARVLAGEQEAVGTLPVWLERI